MSFNPHSNAQSAAAESAYTAANNELAGKLLLLNELVINLHHRLNPVLGPSVKSIAAGGGEDQSVRVDPAPLVSVLENHATSVDAINEQISELLKRLCL